MVRLTDWDSPAPGDCLPQQVIEDFDDFVGTPKVKHDDLSVLIEIGCADPTDVQARAKLSLAIDEAGVSIGLTGI
jgi:hypothetical protein